MNWELPDVQAGLRKGRGTRDQITNIHWIIEKTREFQKNIYFCFDYAKAFDCVDHNKLWKILKEMGIPDHLIHLLRNLYAGQEATGTWNVRSMNQGKLEVVKQEMARVNVDILGISELKWTGMGEFNSDDHYIYYCGQESLRQNGVAIIVNKRV